MRKECSSRENNGPKIECTLLMLKLVCSAARMSEEGGERALAQLLYYLEKSSE